jgi:hypothetical protein
VLEYGEAYLEGNACIVDAMSERMSPEAVAYASRMASEALEDDEEDMDAGLQQAV